jgi:hypothetical protein
MTPPATPTDDHSSALRRRRDELAELVAEQQWDLGGLAYEMAIRDHFRIDVLVRRAAQLQERDAELAEVERLLRLEESASAGACPSCGAPHSRGALFCWQCGATLMERATSEAASAQQTAEHGTVRPDEAGAEAVGPDAGEHGAAKPGMAGQNALRPDDVAEQDTLIVDPILAAEK